MRRAGAEEESPFDVAVCIADGDAEAVVERRAGVRAQWLRTENGRSDRAKKKNDD